MLLATCRAADAVRGRYPRTLARAIRRIAERAGHDDRTSARFFRTQGINRCVARSSTRKPNWFCREEAVSCRSRNGQPRNVEAKSR